MRKICNFNLKVPSKIATNHWTLTSVCQPRLLTFQFAFSRHIFRAKISRVCLENLSTCYKFPSAVHFHFANKRTRTRFEARIYLLIIYARLARSRRKSLSRKRRKTKQNVSLILAPVTARETVVDVVVFLPLKRANCVKNSTCGSYFARFSRSISKYFICKCRLMFTFHVLGKYYDRTTWNYHPRSDVKATPSATIWLLFNERKTLRFVMCLKIPSKNPNFWEMSTIKN